LIRQAASIATHMLKNYMLKPIEDTIDEEKKTKHTDIVAKVEKVFENPKVVSEKVWSDIMCQVVLFFFLFLSIFTHSLPPHPSAYCIDGRLVLLSDATKWWLVQSDAGQCEQRRSA
jgi:hypothetical protein